MSVYNDMANDAGYGYGTADNQQMAEMLEHAEWHAQFEQSKEEADAMEAEFDRQYDEYLMWCHFKECRHMWE